MGRSSGVAEGEAGRVGGSGWDRARYWSHAMRSFETWKRKRLKDPKFKATYDALKIQVILCAMHRACRSLRQHVAMFAMARN